MIWSVLLGLLITLLRLNFRESCWMNTGSLNCSHGQKMSKSGIPRYSHLSAGIMLHAVLSADAMRQPRIQVIDCQASNPFLPMFGAKETCPGAV